MEENISKMYFPQKKNLINIIRGFNYYKYSENTQNKGLVSVFPNANTNIIFTLVGHLKSEQENIGAIEVSSVCTMPLKLKQSEKVEMIVIQLNPYSLYYLFGVPTNKLLNTALPLEDLFCLQEINELRDKLLGNDNPLKKMTIVEAFLSQKIGEKEVLPRILKAQNLIVANSSVSMDYLSETLCISPSGLRKMFQKYFGMSPKFYSRIKRFNLVVNNMVLNPDINLTTTALNAGYYDQAHFIKEFKMFTSISPKTYKKNKAAHSDYYDLVC